MQKETKYTIFKTKWGYFGLAGTTRLSSSGSEYGLLRTCLPFSSPEKVKSRLLISLEAPLFEKRLFKTVQDRITAYFEGACVNFASDIPIVLDGLSDFCCSVLTACRSIEYGQFVTYSALAKRLCRPAAARTVRNSTRRDKHQKEKISNRARSVGNALARNPLPLIIPCHRVIRNDGTIGGFSAPGGKSMKARMLKHEQQVKMRGESV